MKDGFEVDIYDTDPTVKNDRYAILICTDEDWPDADDAENLLRGVYGWLAGNIMKFKGADATSVNLQNAINAFADIADKNL